MSDFAHSELIDESTIELERTSAYFLKPRKN